MSKLFTVNGVNVTLNYGTSEIPVLVDNGAGLLSRVHIVVSAADGQICSAYGQPYKVELSGPLMGWGNLSCDYSYILDDRIHVSGPLMAKFAEINSISLPSDPAWSK